MTESQRSNSRILQLSGLALAATGVAHFVKPALFESITAPAFPRRTQQHIYTNGAIETALGLGLSVPKTRPAAVIGTIGYVVYLGAAAVRNAR